MHAPALSKGRLALIILAMVASGTFRWYFPKHGMHGRDMKAEAVKEEGAAEIARLFPSKWTPPAATASAPEAKAEMTAEQSQQVAAALEKCRGLFNGFERAHSETLRDTPKTRIIRMHPPTKEELDSAYVALTKEAESFPDGSAAGEIFRERATALIEEYSTYEYPGRILVLQKDSVEGPKVTSVEFEDASTTVKIGAEGALDIESGEIHTGSLKDWQPRYGHFFENP